MGNHNTQLVLHLDAPAKQTAYNLVFPWLAWPYDPDSFLGNGRGNQPTAPHLPNDAFVAGTYWRLGWFVLNSTVNGPIETTVRFYPSGNFKRLERVIVGASQVYQTYFQALYIHMVAICRRTCRE
jgi:hypothetical protein